MVSVADNASVFVFVFAFIALKVEVVEFVVEVVDEQQLGALAPGVARIFLREVGVEVGHVELVLQLWHDRRLDLELAQGVEVDVGEPRMVLDGRSIVFVAQSLVRRLLEELWSEGITPFSRSFTSLLSFSVEGNLRGSLMIWHSMVCWFLL